MTLLGLVVGCSIILVAEAFNWMQSYGNCYKVLVPRYIGNHASLCQDFGYITAEPVSFLEMTFMRVLIGQRFGKFLVGLEYSDAINDYRWINQRTVPYANYWDHEKTSAIHKCVFIRAGRNSFPLRRTYYLRGGNCTDLYSVICQKPGVPQERIFGPISVTRAPYCPSSASNENSEIACQQHCRINSGNCAGYKYNEFRCVLYSYKSSCTNMPSTDVIMGMSFYNCS